MKKAGAVRVAVIGAGSVAKYRHVPEYAGNKFVNIVAVCDKVAANAEKLAKQFGGKVFTDWHDVVKSNEVDAISVCTPNNLHAPVTIAALKAGKHVLCEKPMATSASEAEAMVTAAKENKKILMIGHNQRLAPLHIRAKQILQSGMLGRVITFRTNFAHPGPEGWSIEGVGGWFFQKKQAFVGAMGDLGVHKADLIRWLLKDEIVEVAAFVEALAGKKNSTVDDNAICLFRLKSGAIGSMTVSWSHQPGEDNSTVFYCEKGIMRIGADPTYTVIVELADGEKQMIRTKGMQTNEEGGQTSSGVIDTFIDCIVKGTPCPIPGEEGARSLGVILACMKSAATKRFVSVASVSPKVK